jgi:hypothetical protein
VPDATQTTTKCGERGDRCATCGTRDCHTENGVCLDTSGGCSAANCANGCCRLVNGVSSCQVNQPTACGTGGGACVACTPGVTCNGACTTTINPNYNFRVFMKSLDIDSRIDGECWDWNFGCASEYEFLACFGYFQSTTLLEGCATVKVVTDPGPTSPIVMSYNDTDGLVKLPNGQPIYIKGSTITAGQMRISIREDDLDIEGDDIVAQGYLVNKTSNPQLTTVNNWQSGNQLKFELR